MNKILDVLLFPLSELVCWLVLRDLRRADWRYDREVLDKTPTLAQDIIDRLELENRNLVGCLGAAHERIRTLESQVKLLTTPHKPWWRRLIRRKE
ncbi:hypothetical protein ES705_41029 [subsurface metagenome]|jgi:hypothetical protein